MTYSFIRPLRFARTLIVALAYLLLIGCTAGSGDGLDENGRPLGETPDDGGSPPPAASFQQIQQDVFDPLCIVCHAGAAAPVGLKLDAANSFSSLVNVPSVQAPSLLRVAPADPDTSYLVQKIEGTAAVGGRMPLGGAPVPATLVAALRQWIDGGALPGAPPTGQPVTPVVAAMVPQPGSVLTTPPDSIAVVFNTPMDFTLAGADTVRLTGGGGDGVIGTADDVTVVPASVLPSNPQTLIVDLAGVTLADDDYLLVLAGAGTLVLTSLDGTVLDGDQDGQPGGDYEAGFTISAAAAQPEATWRWIQDNVFSATCTQCHAAGGIAEFLLLDEANSFDSLVNRSSTEVGDLFLVAPGDAENSYLMQKVAGTATVGERMPLNLPPLADDVIGVMRQWIDGGALLEPGDPMPDTLAPQVSLAAPGSTLSGTVLIGVAAADDVGVVAVSLFVDGDSVASDDTLPFEFELDTTQLTDGSHLLRAEATDAAGNTGLSEEIAVDVDNAPPPDTQAPEVTVSIPAGVLAGTVTVVVDAVDNVGVETVQLIVDDTPFASDSQAPYEFAWSTTSFANGEHVVRAEATDAAGNTGVSADVSATVDNSLPADTEAPQVSISPPASPASGLVTITVAATDNVAVTIVELLVDGVVIAEDVDAPYEFLWDTTAFANGDRDLAARAADLAGNVGVSTTVTVMVANAPPADTTAPVVSIVPPAGAVSAVAQISVDASDLVGVTGVRLFADGSQVGVLTGAPYLFSWDVTALTDGAHVLTAEAADAAGNTGYADPIVVQVANGTPQPSLPWIQDNIFTDNCTVGCHSSGSFASFLLLTEGDSFSQLVNAESTEGGAEFRVLPGDPDESSLVQRLEGDLSPQMPFGGDALPAAQIAAVRDWITGGALEAPADTIAPASVLRLPPAPASGTVTIAAVVADNVAVIEARFFVDGALVGSDTTAPFEVAFDTTLVADGDRVVTVEAEDAAGNIGVSSAQVLTVANN